MPKPSTKPRYRQVAEAYIAGIETRLAQGEPVQQVACVASFFVSRIDALLDPLLEAPAAQTLCGQVAIASAKIAYQIYQELFNSERFGSLEAQGATVQRLLWASTSSKNPAFSDVKYVEALIGTDTVNTLPLETLNAYRDHGAPQARLEQGIAEAHQVLAQLPALGIDLDQLTQQLEDEGVEKFNKPFDKLLTILAQRIAE